MGAPKTFLDKEKKVIKITFLSLPLTKKVRLKCLLQVFGKNLLFTKDEPNMILVNVKCCVKVENHFLTFTKHMTFTRIVLGMPYTYGTGSVPKKFT